MNVIGFLCVSLGSSTVQLHDIRNACASSEWLVLVVKMANVQRSVLRFFFCGKEDSMQRICIKNCFLFTTG
jgi:hypothetical protein